MAQEPLKASTENKMDRLKNLMQREGYAGMVKKTSPYTGLKGKPDTRVAGSTKYGLYYDSRGILTGGIGDKIDSKEEADKYMTISDEAAIKIFNEETVPSHDKGAMELLKRQGIDPTSLSDSQLDAVKDMVFQLGSKVDDKFPKLFKAIKEGNYKKASYEASHNNSGGASDWMKQTSVRVKDFQKRIRIQAVKKDLKNKAIRKIVTP